MMKLATPEEIATIDSGKVPATVTLASVKASRSIPQVERLIWARLDGYTGQGLTGDSLAIHKAIQRKVEVAARAECRRNAHKIYMQNCGE